MTDSDGAGSRAWGDSLKRNQDLVRGVVWHAGQSRPLDTDLLAPLGLDGGLPVGRPPNKTSAGPPETLGG
jgi:hypothetical protein